MKHFYASVFHNTPEEVSYWGTRVSAQVVETSCCPLGVYRALRRNASEFLNLICKMGKLITMSSAQTRAKSNVGYRARIITPWVLIGIPNLLINESKPLSRIKQIRAPLIFCDWLLLWIFLWSWPLDPDNDILRWESWSICFRVT